jgi:hypothetical protein
LLAWLLAGAVFADIPQASDSSSLSAEPATVVYGDCGKRADMAGCKVRCLTSTAGAANATSRLSAFDFPELSDLTVPVPPGIARAPDHAPPKVLSV